MRSPGGNGSVTHSHRARGEEEEEEAREEISPAEADEEHHGNGRDEGESDSQPSSMQAQRLQRIRGNYQDETRELPSGQDWPSSHSAVEEREEVVGARDSIPKATTGDC